MSGYQAPVPFARPPERPKNRWLLWVFFGCGVGSFVGFIMAAIKVQSARFVTAAVVAVLGAGVSIATMQLDDSIGDAVDDTTSETASDVGWSYGIWVFVIVWAALAIYALVLLPEYKRFVEAEHAEEYVRWNAARAQAHGLYAPQPSHPVQAPQAPPAPPAPAPPREDVIDAEVDRYVAVQPPGNRSGATPPNAPAP